MTLELSWRDVRFQRPYAEATTSAQTIATNTFTGANLTTSVRDNGAVTTGAAMVDLAGDVINLPRAGLWHVTATVIWGTDLNVNGYRAVSISLNFFGGTHAQNIYSNTTQTTTGSTGALINVGNNTGYGAQATVYHNSTSANLTATTTLRATWLAPFHA
jgi:hypothetical protein